MRHLITTTLFLVAAGTVLAADNDRTQLLLKLIRENGCQMDGNTASSVLPKYGFTRTETREIEAELLKKGMIDTTKLGVIALTASACSG